MTKKKGGSLKLILEEFKPQYVTLFVFSAVINILMLVPAWYMLQVYDRVLTSYDKNTLYGLTLIVVFLYLVYGFMERYRGLILVGLSEMLDHKSSGLIHNAILTPSLREKQQDIAGLQDLNTVKQFLTGQPILAFLDGPWVFIFLLVIYMLHPLLGAVALLSVVVLFVIALFNQRATGPKLALAQQDASTERRFVSNALMGSESIQVMGMRGLLKQQMAKYRNAYLENHIDASQGGANWSSVGKFFRVVIQSSMLGYGGYLAINNEITAGMMIAASILMGRALAPIEGVINSWKQLGDFKKSYNNLDEILSTTRTENHSIDLGRPKGQLQLIDVGLQLRPNGRPTLEKINLLVEAGETLAIIGPSGAGKTSLLKVMCGLYMPSSGQALIDGADLAHRDLDSLGKHLGYLSQTTELLAGKISENIARFGDISNDDVLSAAQMSGAHEVALSMPEGYDSVLGEAGAGLSEGQKRKLGLARAFYGKPAIVFLDEPGNGLDDASMLTIIKAIQELQKQGVTVVFTTHQSALVQLSNKVLVLVQGQVKYFGDKAQVLEKISATKGVSK
jgi:ATP-binding cassette subfamily C exporter for protease/lipase